MLEDPQDLICLKKADDLDRLSRMLRENMGFLLGYFFEVWPLNLNCRPTAHNEFRKHTTTPHRGAESSTSASGMSNGL